MAKLNQFENLLFEAMRKAHLQYDKLAGETLRHAPESFIQTIIALELSKKGSYKIYPDSTLTKVFRNHSNNVVLDDDLAGKRFDLVVWSKSQDNIKSIIEIKKSRGSRGTQSDSIKIRDFLDREHRTRSAYLIVYSDSEREDTLRKRFERWADQCNAKLLEFDIGKYADPGEGKTCDGWALIRLNVT